MENKESIKSTYLVLFIVGIIETVLALFLGGLIGIAVFIIALILRSKLTKENLPTTPGIKLMLIGSGIQIGTLILGLMNFIIALITYLTYSGTFFINFISIISWLFNFGAFVVLIIGCILVYKEYDAIK